MKHCKRIPAVICVVVIALSAFMPVADAAAPSMDNFRETSVYTPGQFPDISENEWFGCSKQGVVRKACQLGLMGGTDKGFNPGGIVTLAEVITVAARVRNIYNGGEYDFGGSSPWYYTYVTYAAMQGIYVHEDFGFEDVNVYNKPSTRAEMADIFSRALPESEYKAQNTVDILPDIDTETPYSDGIFMLYRAGILTGSDEYGTFNPYAYITRAEAAAIITRIALPSERKVLNLKPFDNDNPNWEKVYTKGMRVDTIEELSALIDAAGRNMIPEFEITLSRTVYDKYVEYGIARNYLHFGSSSSRYNYRTEVFSYSAEYTMLHQMRGVIFNRDAAENRVSREVLDYDAQMRAILAKIITAGMSEREKIKAVHDYMVMTYRYDLSFQSGTYDEAGYRFYGLLRNKTGVCQAYAELFYLLMSYEDIKCELVFGTADGGSGVYGAHAWNVVYPGGERLHVDVTFDDPVPDRDSVVFYDYFLKTDAQMSIDHKW